MRDRLRAQYAGAAGPERTRDVLVEMRGLMRGQARKPGANIEVAGLA